MCCHLTGITRREFGSTPVIQQLKDDLRDFFIKHASARECYNATSSENSYLEKLRRAVARMSWDEISVVTEVDFIAKFDNTSYLVMLVRPGDDARLN